MPPIDAIDLKINTGRPVRYGPKKRAWYRIFEILGRSGRTFYVGAFGCFGRLDTQRIEPDGDVDPCERERIREQVRVATEREAHKRARQAQRAADDAHETWRRASPVGESEYLRRKRVAIDGGYGGWIRFDDELVVVPMVRYDAPEGPQLKGVQIIRPDGQKRFPFGMEKTGTAAVLGEHQPGEAILLCEGLATALSVWIALDRRRRVAVAFDAGNLYPALEALSAAHQDARFGICADDDFQTGDIGRQKAQRAAKKVGGVQVLLPHFARRGDQALTDFNDLHVTEGLAAVAAQVRRFVGFIETL